MNLIYRYSVEGNWQCPMSGSGELSNEPSNYYCSSNREQQLLSS
jgi:hypothetical protein